MEKYRMIVVVDVEADQDLGLVVEYRDDILSNLLGGVMRSFKQIKPEAKISILNIEGTILKGSSNEEADHNGVTEDYAANPT